MPVATTGAVGKRTGTWVLGAMGVCLGLATAVARADDDAGLELFERRIRPYLVERCYGCHATHGTRAHDLALDWAGGMRDGGWSGAAVVPGRPDESLILAALKHENDLPMPKGGPKPSADVVAAFTRWIELGAPDPRATPPDAATLAHETSWEETFRRRLTWWSLQPIARPAAPPPVVARDAAPAHPLRASDHPVDRFIAARLATEAIEPAVEADRETLLRRAALVLTGLPPTPAEREAFLADTSPDAWERLVDRLIESPAFAERWARHWLDCVRYCETHGSEGDPAIPHAWRFRDWCIRAIRDDLPIDRFIREQIAGDLLDDPRIDPATGINESALGVGHLRMVPHGFNPTDPLDEMVTFTDNQIDVFSKAFLGLTVSCARCHDHKFDAISQADFHAIYGVFASCRPAIIHADAPGRHATARAELAALKPRLRQALAQAWLAAIDALPSALAKVPGGDTALRSADHPLEALVRLAALTGQARQEAWDRVQREAEAVAAASSKADGATGLPPLADWLRYGAGIDGPSPPGAFRVEPEGERVITRLLPAGIHSNLLASNDGAMLHSPRFPIDMAKVRLIVAGEGKARVRVVVWHYPRALGLNYQRESLDGGGLRVVTLATDYFRGDQAHIEIATARDLPVEAVETPRSFFSLIATDDGQGAGPPAHPAAPLLMLLPPADPLRVVETAPDASALFAGCQRAATAAVTAWQRGTATDAQVRLLDALCQIDALPTRLADLPALTPLVERYRAVDRSIPPPTRSPGVVEGTVVNQPLFVRGDHRRPADPVPRRFLEALDPRPFGPADSGRRELADRLVAATNPLTPRVFVNRVWHHVFGRGLVASVDNLGQMGDLPSHPELLDFLAAEFTTPADAGEAAARPWSLKSLVRLLATSRTFRLATRPTESARTRDPANLLLSHARLRRLESEAIRDSLLACAGRLDATPFGPPQPGSSHRRGVYVAVRRNALDPFLAAFDPPSTTSTQGRRDESHVPAQALVFFNDPWVHGLAEHAAGEAVRQRPDATLGARVREAFIAWLGREPTATEMAATRAWVEDLAAAHGVAPTAAVNHPGVVADLHHGLLQTEEFVHVP